MSQLPKTEPAANGLPADPYPDYPPQYSWFFQAWLIMFLAVICLAIVSYLLSYLPL